MLKRNPLRSADVGGEIVCWSGDRVVEDEEGYLYFVAREDAMIKSWATGSARRRSRKS